MGRKKLVDRDEIKVSFTITIEQKWINNQDHEELRRVACDSISKYVEQHSINNQKTK